VKKIFLLFSNTILVLTFLSAFAWLIKEANSNSEVLGKGIDIALIKWSSFPDKFSKAVDQIQHLPETFVSTPKNFTPINKLEDDILVLFTYSSSNSSRNIELKNLRTDSLLKSWQIKGLDNSHRRVMHPLLMEDDHVIYASIGVPGVFCIDESSKMKWKQDQVISHHSLNRDHNNHIWLCTYPTLKAKEPKYDAQLIINDKELPFIDNSITCLDYENGMILFHRSLSQILIDNDLESILLKSSQASDPLHINDVQPVLTSGQYLEKGDLFISCKNISTVLLYRPTTNTIIDVIEGPFQSQHDVDIINDSTISIFNNNTHTIWQNPDSDWTKTESKVEIGPLYSQILFYHFNDDSFSLKDEKSMTANKIYTFTEGLSEKLFDGAYFVEEQNSGVLWVLKDDEVLYKNVLKSHHDGYHHLPNWARIIND
jgi:hypothetical protein